MITSKKLFEIPIYALDRNTLKRRVQKAEKSYEKEYMETHRNPDINHYRECLRLLLYPQRLWDYNHIIGYITIKSDGQDILLEEYLPYATVERYHWHGQKKHFVVNQMSPGMHFYIGKKSSQEIKESILLFLNDYDVRLKKRGYILDREAFDNVVPYIDFKRLVDMDSFEQIHDVQLQ